MDKLTRETVHVIERTHLYGPEERREKEVQVLAAFHEEFRAMSWLRSLLEDEYGFDLFTYRVDPSPDQTMVRVYENRKDGDFYRYEIKKGELLITG